MKNVSLDAFDGCTSLESLRLGKRVKEFSLAVLATSGNLRSVYIYNKNSKLVGGRAYKNLGGNSNVTIYGKENSTAKKSAKKYGIKFKVISK